MEREIYVFVSYKECFPSQKLKKLSFQALNCRDIAKKKKVFSNLSDSV